MSHDDVPEVIVTWGQYEAAVDSLRTLIEKGPSRTSEETGLMSRLAQRILDYERRTMSPDDPLDFIM
jgi:hypothetical protein